MGKRKKVFIFVLVIATLACIHLTQAQETQKVRRIGVLFPGSLSYGAPNVEAFRRGLRELGYVEDKNIVIYYRIAEGKLDRYPILATELVNLKVDVIVTASAPVVQAVKKATKTIPIVIAAAADPIGAGLIDSLARPGGNVTGLSRRSPDLGGKRLQLLKEIVPSARRVGILWNPTNDGSAVSLRESETAAQLMGLQLQSIEVRSPGELNLGLKLLTADRTSAFTVLRDPFINQHISRIVEFAAKAYTPAIYEAREFALVGGLISYGANLLDLYRRAAGFVDKILKGAKPDDLPVEQPMRTEFIINLKTAKDIGLTIPAVILQRADKVIK